MKHSDTDRNAKGSLGIPTEEYVITIMQKEGHEFGITNVINCSRNGKADVEFKSSDGIKRGLQVKTLTKTGKDSFTAVRVNYHPNMLIVMVNNDRNRFVLGYASQFSIKSPTTMFNSTKTYPYMTTTNEKLFIEKCLSMAKNSLPLNDETNFTNPTLIKEQAMTKRLEKQCAETGLLFRSHSVSATAIDCYINGRSSQQKFSSQRAVNISRRGGKINGINQHIPYSSDDFDFLIVEMEHSLGHFYIFPAQILTERGYLKTNFQFGKTSFTIPPPDKCTARTEWTKEYFDRFDLFTPNTILGFMKSMNASSKQVVNN